MDKLNSTAAVPVLLGIILFLTVGILLLGYVSKKRMVRYRARAISDDATKGLNCSGFGQEAKKHLIGPHAAYAVVTLQVCNYGQIMETFGYEQGNAVLRHVHNILKNNLSTAEPVGRITGGTFCFLMKNRQTDVIRARLMRVFESVNQFNQDACIPYIIDLRFGVYITQNNTESLWQMMEKSASVLNEDGCTCCGFYRDASGEPPARKWELVNQMNRAIQGGEFLIYLQPKVRLSDNRIVGAEAMLRWRHPQRGLLTPEMFVPMLEEYHLSDRFDLHLFELICQQMEQWSKEGRAPCPVCMRLTPQTLKTEHFMEPFVRLGDKYGINPELIEFELSSIVQNQSVEQNAAIVDEIHKYNFRCALGNFGAETIALHLLRGLNVDTIKLDRSLLSGENNNRCNRFVVEAIIKIATQMQIYTVAEGIGNSSQVQYLKQAGCDMVQGVHYFAPMSVDDFCNTAFDKDELRYVEESDSHTTQNSLLAGHHTSSSIVMFSLLLSADRVEFSSLFSPLLEGKSSINGAQALFRHSALIHENDRKDFFHLLERCQKENGWVDNMIRFYTAKGRYEWLEVHLHREYEKISGETVIFGTLVNMASWKGEVDRWKEKANRDALTGLYNREYFEQFASAAVEKNILSTAAAVFVDIDDFKKVNDTLGHMVGDDVICFVAKRVLGTFRHSDIVARYGGDEFVVFVNGVGREDLSKRLKQLCDGFRYPYRNGTIEYPVSVSIGAAMFPEDGKTYLELLDCADCAAYTAKRRGKNQFAVYQPDMENASEK